VLLGWYPALCCLDQYLALGMHTYQQEP